MKYKMASLISLLGASLITFSLPAAASLAGFCNDANFTQYICCPSQGGWIVSKECDQNPSPYCVNDKGLIAGSTPPVAILQDCKNRGGSDMLYPF